MFITYDSDADAVYVTLQAPEREITETREIDLYRYVDYDEDERVVGVEFLGVSRGIDLRGEPEAERVAEALATLPRVAGWVLPASS